jgi:FlaA1/EpsC-like NDP-sugar epimerase
MLLGLGAITRRETEFQRRLFSTLGVILVGLVIVMLVSAFQRLVLYEEAYGFSRLRTYTHVFMIWLGLLLIAVVFLEITRRERMAALAMIIAALGFIVSLNLLNVDAFIVGQNLQREFRAEKDAAFARGRADLDAQYFLDLSDDSIPVMATAFLDTSLPETVREKTGAALACKRYEREQGDRTYPWQAFHFSRYNADLAFARIDKQLDAYKIKDSDFPYMVITPGGEEFPCYQYYYD